MKKDAAKPVTVEEYLADLSGPVRKAVERARGTIRKALPGAQEAISYGIPAFKIDGRVVIYVAGWKEHFSIYPANDRLIAAFEDELEPYERSGRGTIRFPLAPPVPATLIAGIAKFLARESADRAAAQAAKKKRTAAAKKKR